MKFYLTLVVSAACAGLALAGRGNGNGYGNGNGNGNGSGNGQGKSSDSKSSSSSSSSDEAPTTLSFATYNTLQIVNADNLEERAALQIAGLAQLSADIDVLCLQELFFKANVEAYQSPLQNDALYPYAVSELDFWTEEQLTSTSNCDADEAAAYAPGGCIDLACGDTYAVSPDAFVFCSLLACPDEGAVLAADSSCPYCIGFSGQPTVAEAVAACQGFPVNTEPLPGTLLLSKYPLRDAFLVPMPGDVTRSWQALFAVIDGGDVPGLDDDKQITVGCVHLAAPTGNAAGIPLISYDPVVIAAGVTTNTELHALQAQVLAEDLAAIDGPLVMLGDFNMAARDDYFGDVLTDFEDVSGVDLLDLGQCTYCGASNPLTTDEELDFDVQIDFVGTRDLKRVARLQSQVRFLDEAVDYVDDGVAEALPLSDHYGVLATFTTDCKRDSKTDNDSSNN